MTKNTSHISSRIVCPKCQTKTMRLAHGKSPLGEYFSDCCHFYWSVSELVNQWGYDGADSLGDDLNFPPNNVWGTIVDATHAKDKRHLATLDSLLEKYPVVEDKLVATSWFDGISVIVCDEPVFKSLQDKLTSYEVVTRMLLGIPEWEDDSVDTGALHV